MKLWQLDGSVFTWVVFDAKFDQSRSQIVNVELIHRIRKTSSETSTKIMTSANLLPIVLCKTASVFWFNIGWKQVPTVLTSWKLSSKPRSTEIDSHSCCPVCVTAWVSKSPSVIVLLKTMSTSQSWDAKYSSLFLEFYKKALRKSDYNISYRENGIESI